MKMRICSKMWLINYIFKFGLEKWCYIVYKSKKIGDNRECIYNDKTVVYVA